MTGLGIANMIAQVFLFGIGLYLLFSQGLAPGMLVITYVLVGHPLARALSTGLMALYDRYLRSEESTNKLKRNYQIEYMFRTDLFRRPASYTLIAGLVSLVYMAAGAAMVIALLD